MIAAFVNVAIIIIILMIMVLTTKRVSLKPYSSTFCTTKTVIRWHVYTPDLPN